MPESQSSVTRDVRLVARVAEVGGRAVVAVVLYEDLYETRVGDGLYRYFDDAFWTEREARDHIDRKRREQRSESREDTVGREWVIRAATLSLSGDGHSARVEEVALERFEEAAPEKILDALLRRV